MLNKKSSTLKDLAFEEGLLGSGLKKKLGSKRNSNKQVRWKTSAKNLPLQLNDNSRTLSFMANPKKDSMAKAVKKEMATDEPI